jgi:hypothetical protein
MNNKQMTNNNNDVSESDYVIVGAGSPAACWPIA